MDAKWTQRVKWIPDLGGAPGGVAAAMLAMAVAVAPAMGTTIGTGIAGGDPGRNAVIEGDFDFTGSVTPGPTVDALMQSVGFAPGWGLTGASTPVFFDGKQIQYVSDGSSSASALLATDLVTGSVAWVTEVEPVGSFGNNASPAVDPDSGTVVIGSGSALTALNASNGTLRWQTPLTNPVANASPAISEGKVYISDFNGGFGTPATDASLYAVDLATGSVEWTRTLGFASGATPTVVDGVAYVPSFVGGFGGTDAVVRAFDADTGATLFEVDLPDGGFETPFGGLSYEDGFLYLSTYDFFGNLTGSSTFKIDADPDAIFPTPEDRIVWEADSNRTNATPVVFETEAGEKVVIVSGGDEFGGTNASLQFFSDLTGSLLGEALGFAGYYLDQPLVLGNTLVIGAAEAFPGVAPSTFALDLTGFDFTGSGAPFTIDTLDPAVTDLGVPGGSLNVFVNEAGQTSLAFGDGSATLLQVAEPDDQEPQPGVVPEPAVASLALMGMVGLLRRRR